MESSNSDNLLICITNLFCFWVDIYSISLFLNTEQNPRLSVPKRQVSLAICVRIHTAYRVCTHRHKPAETETAD